MGANLGTLQRAGRSKRSRLDIVADRALACYDSWIVARRRKLFARSVIYVVSFLVLFGPALFFCFERLARLLPESV